MNKRLSCNDLDMVCEFSVCAQTVEEVLSETERHIQAVHRIKGVSKEFYEKIQSAIRDGYCDLEGKSSTAEGVCYTEACLYM